jgi:hypothetical protein
MKARRGPCRGERVRARAELQRFVNCSRNCSGRARLAARTLAMYARRAGAHALLRPVPPPTRGRCARCSRPGARAGWLQLHARPGRAQHRHHAGGLARAVPLVGPRGASRSTRPWACAPPKAAGRCPRRCRWSRRWRWPSFEPRGARCCARATTASSNCSTAAGCAWPNWWGWICAPATRRPAGSTPPTPARRCWARAASAARAGGGAGAGRTARLAGAARPGGWRRRRAGAVRQPPRRRLSASQVRKRLKAQALRPECPRTCTRTCCATASRRTCCSPAATCARCRSCWATPTSATTQVYTRLDFQHLAKVYDAAHPRAAPRVSASSRAACWHRPSQVTPSSTAASASLGRCAPR